MLVRSFSNATLRAPYRNPLVFPRRLEMTRRNLLVALIIVSFAGVKNICRSKIIRSKATG